jgi:hypothetical protein
MIWRVKNNNFLKTAEERRDNSEIFISFASVF